MRHFLSFGAQHLGRVALTLPLLFFVKPSEWAAAVWAAFACAAVVVVPTRATKIDHGRVHRLFKLILSFRTVMINVVYESNGNASNSESVSAAPGPDGGDQSSTPTKVGE